MGHGRESVSEPRVTTTKGEKKTQKHTHGRAHRFGTLDPLLPHRCKHKSPQGLSLQAFRLFAERVPQSEERQTVVLEGGVGRASMRPHPGLKGHKAGGVRTWQSRWDT